MQLHFENPVFFWGFLPLLGLAALMLYHGKRYPLSFSVRRFSFACLAFAFGIIALSRPQLGRRVTASMSRGSQIIFAIDISKSMLAEDTTPSRLQFAISFTQKLLSQLSQAKVAIFPFAADGYLQVPLTTDVFAASDMTSLLTPSLTTHQGTDLSRSLVTLLTQIDRLEQAAREKGTDWLPTQVVLISDGESHHELRSDVLNQFRSRRIPIFTVGTGSPSGAFIPAESRYGMRDNLRDNDGKQVLTKLSVDTLQKISKATGGDYFSGRFEEVFRLRDRLNQSVTLGKLSSTFKMEKEYFPLFLCMAVILFVLEFSFGRWEYTIRSLTIFFLITLVGSPSALAEPSAPVSQNDTKPSAIESYNNGLKELENNPNRAAELFQESATLSDSPHIRKKALYNLGNSLLKGGDPVQALQAYQQAYDLQTSDDDFNREANQKISDNLVLAAKVLEKMKQQQQEGGEGQSQKDQEGKPGKSNDPKGPQKNYEAQLFNESQKKKIFDLIASDEQQTLQRVQDQRNRNKPTSPTEKPW